MKLEVYSQLVVTKTKKSFVKHNATYQMADGTKLNFEVRFVNESNAASKFKSFFDSNKSSKGYCHSTIELAKGDYFIIKGDVVESYTNPNTNKTYPCKQIIRIKDYQSIEKVESQSFELNDESLKGLLESYKEENLPF